jgi:hypothetical protein
MMLLSGARAVGQRARARAQKVGRRWRPCGMISLRGGTPGCEGNWGGRDQAAVMVLTRISGAISRHESRLMIGPGSGAAGPGSIGAVAAPAGAPARGDGPPRQGIEPDAMVTGVRLAVVGLTPRASGCWSSATLGAGRSGTLCAMWDAFWEDRCLRRPEDGRLRPAPPRSSAESGGRRPQTRSGGASPPSGR